MATSIWKKNVNLELIFKVPSGIPVRNPNTGNYDQTLKTEIVYCSVESNYLVRDLEISGKNQSSVFLEGYLVKPKFAPKWLHTGRVVDAFYIDLRDNSRKKGEFYIQFRPASRFKIVTKVLGSEIQGFFRT